MRHFLRLNRSTSFLMVSAALACSSLASAGEFHITISKNKVLNSSLKLRELEAVSCDGKGFCEQCTLIPLNREVDESLARLPKGAKVTASGTRDYRAPGAIMYYVYDVR